MAAKDGEDVQDLNNLFDNLSLDKNELRCPCPDELFADLSLEIGSFESRLAIYLGLKEDDVQTLENDRIKNQADKIIAMFWKWREIHGIKATYLSLVTALFKDKNVNAAEQVAMFFKMQPKQQTAPTMLTTKQEKEEKPSPRYYPQMSYDPPKITTPYLPPPSRSHSYTPGASRQPPPKDHSICAKKPDNDGWKIIDEFYDKLVTVLCLDESLCHNVLQSLDEYLLIDQNDREIIERLPCVEIKSKAIMRHVSSRITGARNYVGIFAKFVFALEKYDKLKEFHDKMLYEASLYDINLKRTGPRRQVTCQPIQETTTDTPYVSSSYDKDFETSAIKKYSRKMKSVYKKWKPDPKWSPDATPFKIFVDLAVISSDSRLGNDSFSKSTIRYTVDDIMLQKRPLSFDELCKIPYESIVLIEGAPGIGKSMLAYEMCRQWTEEKCLKNYMLLLLLRLRDEKVQKIKTVRELLGHFLGEQSWKEEATQDIIDSEGEGILIILEGYDELPDYIAKSKSIFTEIAEELPLASKVYTSRPSSRHFLTTELRFSTHVEILGFTEESIKEYTYKFFKNDQALIERFEGCLEKSPKVKSCLYIPIYMAIICNIFADENNIPIEGHVTSTKLYEALIKMLLYRHLKSKNPYENVFIENLNSIPYSIVKDFQDLCKLAYEGIRNPEKTTKLTFTIPEDLDTLGLMQKEVQVSPCHGDVVIYSFLHLTMQEFLAAFYIKSQIPHKIQFHFDRYLNVKNFFTMLHFLAGLTKLKRISLKTEDNFHNLNIFQFLFEAENDELMKQLFSDSSKVYKVSRILPKAAPHDMYILGKCIALSQCKWKLSFTLRGMLSEHVEQFREGLSFPHPSSSHAIHDISFKLNEIGNEGLIQILQFPDHLLLQLLSLHLTNTDLNKDCIPALVTYLPKLAQLELLILNNNKFHEGEQLPLIQALSEISISGVCFSKLNPLECKTLLTNTTPYLTSIHLYQLSPPSIAAVLENIPNLPSLADVHLEQSHCTLDTLAHLPQALARLRSIQFVNCALDSTSVPIFTEAIRGAQRLERISLEDNYIDDKGEHLVCEVISRPGSLMELDIRHNLFTCTTVENFIKELFKIGSRDFLLYLSLRWKSFIEEQSFYWSIKNHIKYQKDKE